MTLHTTPTNRKEMVQAISEMLGTPSVYMRAPTYAYRIGPVTVKQDGSTSCDDESVLEALRPMLIVRGYLPSDAVEEQIQEPDPEAVEEPDAEVIQVPAVEATQEPGTDAIQEPGTDAIQEPGPEAVEEPGADVIQEPDAEAIQEPGADAIQELDAELVEEPEVELVEEPDAEAVEEPEPEAIQEPGTDAIQEPDGVLLQLPIEGVTVGHLRNLMAMLYSMQELLSKAIGGDWLIVKDEANAALQEPGIETVGEFASRLADLRASGSIKGIDIDETYLKFELPSDDQVMVLTALFDKILDVCKRSTRLKAQIKPLGENEKYLMHSWLIRIGCGGPDYKALRKRLTGNLTGYCAFPDNARAQKHKARYAEIRQIRREINEEADARRKRP